jgi:hypothetical protein
MFNSGSNDDAAIYGTTVHAGLPHQVSERTIPDGTFVSSFTFLPQDGALLSIAAEAQSML